MVKDEMKRKKIQNFFRIFISIFLMSFLLNSLIFNIIVFTSAKESNTNLYYTINFDAPILNKISMNNKTYTQISMENCLSNGMPGNPSLPIFPLKVLLPKNKITSQINVNYYFPKNINYDFLENPIIPQQEPLSIKQNNSNPSFLINNTIYNSTEPVFDEIYRDGGIGFLRGYPIQTVYLFPVQYMPGTGQVYYFEKMEVTIQLKDDKTNQYAENNRLLRYNDIDAFEVKSLVENPEATETYSTNQYSTFSNEGLCDPNNDYEYVIITNNALNNTVEETYNWDDLIYHRETYSSLNSTKVSVEEIYGCSEYWNDDPLFNDSAALIREFIIDAYQNWNTRYVVLGGDWDSDNIEKQIVPARMFVEYNSYLNSDPYYQMPCDLYYSNLDGNWRDTVRNCWGGGRNSGVNDPYSEVHVGRMTISNAEELSNFIEKIIWYDLYSDDEFVKKSAFFGGDLGWSVTSADYMEEIREGNDPHFYNCDGFLEWNNNNPGLEFNISTRKYSDWGDSIPDSFQTVINNNDACIINHLGHGTTSYALDMTNAQLGSLSNSNFFFSYSAQCLSARFTAGETPEKTLTSKSNSYGAFGLVWNTGYGWGSSTDTNGSSQFLQRNFWDYFFNNDRNDWQIGAAQTYSKNQMSSYIDIDEWHYCWAYSWYSSNLFGDPAQKLKAIASEEPIVLSNEIPLNCSTSIDIGNVSLEINALDPENNILNVTFYTHVSGSWQIIGANSTRYISNISQILQIDDYNRTFFWSVNAHDMYSKSGWNNKTYYFTTRKIHNLTSPVNFNSITYNKTKISLEWSNGDNATHTYIERNTMQNWSKGDGIEIYNGSNNSFDDVGLLSETTYYYRAWSWDEIDNVYSSADSYSFNVTYNSMPQFSNETPSDYSIGIALNPTLSINISDIDNDEIDVLFKTNITGNWELIGSYVDESTGTFSQVTDCFINASAEYFWSVNCTDGTVWYNRSYRFETRNNQPPVFSSVNPANQSTGISVSRSSISLKIEDEEGDMFNWTIITSPEIGFSSSFNDTTGSKILYIDDLDYETTYYWYVSCKDFGSGNWTNRTYLFTTGAQPSNVPTSTSSGYDTSSPPIIPLKTSTNDTEDTIDSSPPERPIIISDFEELKVGVEYNFSFLSYDTDGDRVRYRVSWGDGTNSNWTDYYDSNISVYLSHIWTYFSNISIKVISQDEKGLNSSWSVEYNLIVINNLNTEDNNYSENKNQYYALADQALFLNSSLISDIYDLDEEKYFFIWDFGDGETGFGKSIDHFYKNPGEYQIKLTINDVNGSVVETKTFEVIVYPASNMLPLENSDSSNKAEENNSDMFSYAVVLSMVCSVITGLLAYVFIIKRNQIK